MPRPSRFFASVLLGGLAALCGCGPRETPEDPLRVSRSAPLRASPSPAPSPDARVVAIDREIAEWEAAARDRDPFVERDLEERIANARAMIASFSLEAEIERATRSDRLRVRQSQREWEDARMRERLAAMAARVQVEENRFTMGRERFSMLVAPEESEVIRQGRAGLAAHEERLAAARAEYASLLAAYEAAPEAYFADQSRRLDENGARLRELASLVADARAELEQASAARDRIAAERRVGEARLRELRTRRSEWVSAGGEGPTPR